jgi:L-fuconolactonase
VKAVLSKSRHPGNRDVYFIKILVRYVMKRKNFYMALLTISACFLISNALAANAGLFAFKLYDTHAHLVSPDTDKYPQAGGQMPQAAGQTPSAGGKAPVQGGAGNAKDSGGKSFPGGANTPGERETPEINALLGWMADNGVEGVVGVQKRGTYGYDNSYILDSSDQHKDKMVPVVVLNGEDVNTDDLVEYWTKERGLSGVRFTGAVAENGSLPWLSSKQALKTWAAANKYGLVVDLMPSPPARSPEFIAEVIKLAKAYPNVKVVMDHVAFPDPKGAPDYGLDSVYQAMAKQKNIYYKFTTINLDNLATAGVSGAEMLRRVVDVFGADHVMWGSDVGNSVGKYGKLVERMVEATSKLTDTEKRAVMHDTGKKVFAVGGSR